MKTATIILIITIISIVTAISQVKMDSFSGVSDDMNSVNSMSKVTDADGNIYYTGTRCSEKDNNFDIVTVKYNSLGFMQWINSYNSFSGSVDAGLSLQIDSASNLIVRGTSKTSGKEITSIVLKYTPSGAILNYAGSDINIVARHITSAGTVSSSMQNTGKFELEQNYPDPFNKIVKIKYCMPNLSWNNPDLKLSVFDSDDNMIHTLLVDNEKPGNHETSFDRTGLKGGMYFYRIESGHYSSTRKLILMN